MENFAGDSSYKDAERDVWGFAYITDSRLQLEIYICAPWGYRELTVKITEQERCRQRHGDDWVREIEYWPGQVCQGVSRERAVPCRANDHAVGIRHEFCGDVNTCRLCAVRAEESVVENGIDACGPTPPF